MMDNSFYTDLDQYIARGRSLHARAVRQAFSTVFSSITLSKRAVLETDVAADRA